MCFIGRFLNDGAATVAVKGLTVTTRVVFYSFHGALRPQKPYGLLGTGEEWDRGPL